MPDLDLLSLRCDISGYNRNLGRKFGVKITCLEDPNVELLHNRAIEDARAVGLGSANNGRVVSIPLWASEEGTKRVIWDLFPALQQTDFDYMRVDNRRRLCHIPPDFATPKAWKDSKILGRSALYIRPKTKINEGLAKPGGTYACTDITMTIQ